MHDCIETMLWRDRQGYGRKKVGSRTVLAHRHAWELANGLVPEGLCVLHRCDNPPCINPDHLFLGTRADNNADRDAKGRSKRGRHYPVSAAMRAEYIRRTHAG